MNVSLFITCLTDTFYPRVGQAVVAVLEHLGCRVDFPTAQTCCGQPMYNSGCHADAADLARRMVDVFEKSNVVVTPSGSCCAMIREYYGPLLAGDPRYAKRAEALAAKSYEFAEFLLKVLKVDLKELGCRLPESCEPRHTYHYSCHLRGLGMKDEAASLLQQIEGVEFLPLEKSSQCCGFGGTFAVKYDDISGAMLDDKLACIRKTGAGVLVCNDGGCALNISGGLNRQKQPVGTKHLAEIIAESLGLLEPEVKGAGR